MNADDAIKVLRKHNFIQVAPTELKEGSRYYDLSVYLGKSSEIEVHGFDFKIIHLFTYRNKLRMVIKYPDVRHMVVHDYYDPYMNTCGTINIYHAICAKIN